MNSERYGVYLRIQLKWGKILTKKTHNTEAFHAVSDPIVIRLATREAIRIHSFL